MSRFGWLALFLALVTLAFWLKRNGSKAPATPPAPNATFLDDRLRAIDQARDAVDQMDETVWRQREEMAKANPEAFLRDLEISSRQQRPLTAAEAKRAVEITRRVLKLPVQLPEPGSLRLGSTAVRVEKGFALP